MDVLKIYFKSDSELSEFEAIQKGYRTDVFVKIENTYFNLRVFDIVRLKQEFESEIKSEGYYAIEANLVLVKEASKREIIFTVQKLYEQKYFSEIKPVEVINTGELIEIQ